MTCKTCGKQTAKKQADSSGVPAMALNPSGGEGQRQCPTCGRFMAADGSHTCPDFENAPPMDVYYIDKQHGHRCVPIYGVRPIHEDNFNPMAHHLLTEAHKKEHVQVLIDVVGGREWINLRRENLLCDSDGVDLATPSPTKSNEVIDNAVLSGIQSWLGDTTEDMDDWDWDGRELTVFIDDELVETYDANEVVVELQRGGYLHDDMAAQVRNGAPVGDWMELGLTQADVERAVLDHVRGAYEYIGPDEIAEVVKVEVYGSRTTGQSHLGSDLDVRLYYRGSAREGDAFNTLNWEGDGDDWDDEEGTGERLVLYSQTKDGDDVELVVDINPIKVDEEGVPVKTDLPPV